MIDLTDETFDEAVNVGVTVVDFWATWCKPCAIVEAVLTDLESVYQGRATFARVEVDTQQKTTFRNRVNGTPTVIYFVDGRPVDVLYSTHPQHDYKERLEQILARADSRS